MAKVPNSINPVLIFVLLTNISLISANNVTIESYGVEEGQNLDFKVVKRPERPEFTQGMGFPGGMSMEDFTNLTQVQLDNFTLQPIFESVPAENSNFSIKIQSLPNYTNEGLINVSYNMTEYQLTIGNKLGEPIISRDWVMWVQVLETLASRDYIYDKKVALVDYELTNKTLTSTIIFEPEVPPSIGLLLTQIKINQTQCYFTNSGIQAYMVITTTFSVLLFGDFTSVLFYTYVEPESVDIVNITNITKTNSPTIALNISKVIIPIAGGVAMIVLAIVVFFVLRKRLKA